MPKGLKTPFYDQSSEAYKAERIKLIVKDEEGLLDGEYHLIESFCSNPDCDCRNVYLRFFTTPPEAKELAAINYGWGSREYYEEKSPDRNAATKMREVHIVDASTPELGHAFLRIAKKMLEDANYQRKIKKDYKIFKASLRKKKSRQEETSPLRKKIGRNDPCPCGSGKKYKMCCGR